MIITDTYLAEVEARFIAGDPKSKDDFALWLSQLLRGDKLVPAARPLA